MRQFRFKKAVSFLLAIAMVFTTLTVVSTTEAQAVTKAIQIKNVTGTTKSLNVGKTFTIKTNYTASKLTFKSSKPAIVAVNAKGTIRAKAVGSAKITMTLKSDKTMKKVLSIKVAAKTDPITITNISGTSRKLIKGKSLTLRSNYKASELQYESSDITVATVSEGGIVTANDFGTAVITITSKDNKSIKTEITINVVDVRKLINGKLEETYHADTNTSDYRIFLEKDNSKNDVNLAFSIKGARSGWVRTGHPGEMVNRGAGLIVRTVNPGVSNIMNMTETDCAALLYGGDIHVGNIIKKEIDDYYKVYYTFTTDQELFIGVECLIQSKETNIVYDFDHQYFLKLSKTAPDNATLEAVADSITIENFTIDDLGK